VKETVTLRKGRMIRVLEVFISLRKLFNGTKDAEAKFALAVVDRVEKAK
jgi:hypothetical protein